MANDKHKRPKGPLKRSYVFRHLLSGGSRKGHIHKVNPAKKPAPIGSMTPRWWRKLHGSVNAQFAPAKVKRKRGWLQRREPAPER